MKIGKFELYNLDRQNSHVFGGAPSPFDHCIVYGEEMEKNPLSGKQQRKPVFSGTLTAAHAFIKKASI